MDENTAFTLCIVIVIASLIGILLTANLLVYYCCIKPNKRKNGLATNKLKKNNNDVKNQKLINSDDKIININETLSNKNLLLSNQELNSDLYKYLGISLSEIPFIDEDSKASSLIDIRWNPYKPLF